MECRKFRITLISAENLLETQGSTSMKVFAEVSLNEDLKTTMKTGVDKEGKSNPTWDFRADYTIAESTVQKKGAYLVVNIFCKKSTLGSRFIGKVELCLKNLFDVRIVSETNVVSFPVAKTPNGRLNISYCFGEMILVPERPLKEKLVFFGLAMLGFGELVDEEDYIFAG